MGKILGIDYGDARVGLAITDALKITAQPMDTLPIHGDINILIEKINNLKTKQIRYCPICKSIIS